MRTNSKFIFALIRMKLSRLMTFRLSFFGAFFVDGSMFLIQLLMYQAIYSQVDSIGGWSGGEMIIFVGTFSLINALNMVIFFFGTYDIHNKIKNGDLDQYLTKPVNPLLRLTFESVDPGSVPLVILSIIIIVYGVKSLNLTVTPARFAAYFAFVLIMTLLWYDIQVLFRSVAFFTVSATNLGRIGDTLLELSMKMPGTLYRGVYKVIFYLILPYGIMATFPTQLITRRLSGPGIIYGIAVTVVFTAVTLRF